ncbi:MAG: hypothetical protein QM784_29830 [Polyangiaceae bacterium]
MQTYIQSSAPARWFDAEFSVPVPYRSQFVFNPAICAGEFQGWNTTFLVAVTQDHKLWFRSASGLRVETLSPDWVQIGEDANSSPECVVTNFGSDVYVVVRSTRNSILLYKGSGRGANWLSTDLGIYQRSFECGPACARHRSRSRVIPRACSPGHALGIGSFAMRFAAWPSPRRRIRRNPPTLLG